jgi:hypothetical protein
MVLECENDESFYFMANNWVLHPFNLWVFWGAKNKKKEIKEKEMQK